MRKKSNLKARVISTLILAPLVLMLIKLGDYYYTVLLSILAMLMGLEWQNMIYRHPNSKLWYIYGFIYIVLPCICLMEIRDIPKYGYDITLWLMLSVWATDIGAYFVGSMVGGAKILPKISPSKTWSGLAGGIAFSVIVSYLFNSYGMVVPYFDYVILAPIIAVIAQIGDFMESYVKRRFRVKDSGNIIPGHGGVLDRVDGIVTVAVFVYLIIFWR